MATGRALSGPIAARSPVGRAVSGPVGAVLHIRSGPATGGSAQSRGNIPELNAGEILPCAERVPLHMGEHRRKTSDSREPRNHADAAGGVRRAGANDPPGAPEPGPGEGPDRRRLTARAVSALLFPHDCCDVHDPCPAGARPRDASNAHALTAPAVAVAEIRSEPRVAARPAPRHRLRRGRVQTPVRTPPSPARAPDFSVLQTVFIVQWYIL